MPLFKSALAMIMLLAGTLQGIDAHEGDTCPPRSTITSTKTVTAGGPTPAPDAAFQNGAMRTVIVTRLHTVTRGSTGGDDNSGQEGEPDFCFYHKAKHVLELTMHLFILILDSFESGQKALDDPINDSPTVTTQEEVVEYEYVYTDANGETFVDDASVLYLPTAGPNSIRGSLSGSATAAIAEVNDVGDPSSSSATAPTAEQTDVKGSTRGSFAVVKDDHDVTDPKMDMDGDMCISDVADGTATSATTAAISIKNRQGAVSPSQTDSDEALPASTGGNDQASTSSSDFPEVVAGQEYDDEMSYFKETNHGAECSAPGGIYDSKGACGIINMPDLPANPRDRVSVPQYLWDQFLPAGGVISPTDRGICGSKSYINTNT